MDCSIVPAPSLKFTRDTLIVVICYLVIFTLAIFGNSTLFIVLFRNQSKRRRVHTILLHMTIANLLVTLLFVPKEIIHQSTVAWYGGDTLCRACKFFDVFGVALSANILITLSFDRFFAIVFPLYSINAKQHVFKMLFVAWIVAFLSSLPQIYIFRAAQHPCYRWYTQCVSSDVIKLISPKVTFWSCLRAAAFAAIAAILFSVLNIAQVYFIPLLAIIFCYGSIFVSISIKSGSSRAPGKLGGGGAHSTQTQALLRRTGGQDNFEKAKNRTLRMSIVTVLFFLFCWTPYAVALFTHFLRTSDSQRPIPPLFSKILYCFCVLNTAISPYINYFTVERREFNFLLNCPLPCCLAWTSPRQLSLVGRRRAIRERPVDSQTYNSQSVATLPPHATMNATTTTTMATTRIATAAAESRSLRIRRLGTSPTADSFDEASDLAHRASQRKNMPPPAAANAATATAATTFAAPRQLSSVDLSSARVVGRSRTLKVAAHFSPAQRRSFLMHSRLKALTATSNSPPPSPLAPPSSSSLHNLSQLVAPSAPIAHTKSVSRCCSKQ